MADAIYVTWLELLTLLQHLSSPTVFLVGTAPVLLSALVFCVVLLCVFIFRVSIKTMLGWSLPTIVGRFMSYLRCLCLLAYTGSGVQHILCCVFVLSFLILCTLCCQFLWTVGIRSWLPLRYYLTFMGEDNLIFRSTWCNWQFCFSKYRLVYIFILES